MNKKILILILLIISLVSCLRIDDKRDANLEKKRNIIAKDTFEMMIYDIHVVDALLSSSLIKTDPYGYSDSIVYEELFEKYNYTKNEFDSTLLYYVRNDLDTLNRIYDRVIIRLNTEIGELD